MYVRRLELNGFKSFAKQTVFVFQSPITAIVGPNGSGKSNCAEAMRWVLGEQSMKILRGKRGEDLIFSGSESYSRMSKASVALIFDNAKKQFPLEFNEVVISREVYRDGANEYLVNGSRVRLKDIVELLAHVGLGSSQHHIISQGEADRILHASMKERKEMIEDALSLKIYQIKRAEAERKLDRTKENMKQVETLQKEIQPHLRFLKVQAAKFKKTAELRAELEEKYSFYIAGEGDSLKKAEKEFADQKKKPEEEMKNLEKEKAPLLHELNKEQKYDVDDAVFRGVVGELAEIRNKKSLLLHDRGRLEGMIEMAQTASRGMHDEEMVSREDVEELFTEIEDILSSAIEEDVIEQIHGFVNEALARVSSFFSRIDSRAVKEEKGAGAGDLLRKKKEVDRALEDCTKKEEEYMTQEKKAGGTLHEYQKELRERERAFYEVDTKINHIKDILRSLSIEEERLHLRRQEFERERKEAEHYIGTRPLSGASQELSASECAKLRNDISRLKFKLEDAGGVDEMILRELEEVAARDAFFEKESGDLKKATEELKYLARDLSLKLEREFEKGIAKINKEFQKHFETIFGGGKAELRMVAIEVEENEGELSLEGEGEIKEEVAATQKKQQKESKSGVDVHVNLPRKRIRGLDMLSGGERALTSIALLFALASVNPPPFLVLDEIDAALDESNSRRYGRMLRDLSKETQLIIITHNRESMRNSDVLYGVTMGSGGISKVLSLKLEEAEAYSK